MPIVAADLVLFNAATMPETDSGSSGGAIDLLRRPDFTQIAANDDIEALSSSAGDTTQTVTIEGRTAAGTLISETKTLTGTTAIIFSTLGVVERVLDVELSATCAGTITVRRSVAGATLRVIPIGERGFSMFARKTTSLTSGTQNYYFKAFLKNTHATLALQNSIVKQNADPDARIMHLPAATNDDTATSTNRITAPAAGDTLDPDTFDDADKSVGTLGAGVARGVWLRVQLPTSDTPHKTTYTLELTGEST